MAETQKKKAESPKINYPEMIAVKLREDIVSGRLRPNERLVESDIAQRMKVSRTPVREALQLLEARGYAGRIPGGRHIVTDHSPSQIRNLYEIREALETMALKLACQRATDEDIEQVREIHDRIRAAVNERDISKFIELNSAFHSRLFSLCGNEQLLGLLNTYRDQYYDRRLVRVFTAADWRNMPRQHQKMIDAVYQKNQKLAEKAVHDHITTALRIAIERL